MTKLNKAMALLKAKEEEVAECQRQYDSAMEAKRVKLFILVKCNYKFRIIFCNR